MYSAKLSSKSSCRFIRPLSANLGTAISYDMVVIGHGAGGQPKSHFMKITPDTKTRSNSTAQQKAITTRPRTSQKSPQTVAKTPKQQPALRPRTTNSAVRTPSTRSSVCQAVATPRVTLPVARDSTTVKQTPKQTPIVRPNTAAAISAIMASRAIAARGKVAITPQIEKKLSIVTPSPSDTPICSPPHTYCSIDFYNSVCSVSHTSSTESRSTAEVPSYRGIDALLLQLEKEALASSKLTSTSLLELSSPHIVCGGVSSESAKTEFKLADMGSLEANLKPVENVAEKSNDTVIDVDTTDIKRASTPQSCCKTPRNEVKRSISSRLHLIRQPSSTKLIPNETLINTEEVENGYQLLLLECPDDIVATFMMGIDWFHKEKLLEAFIEQKKLEILPSVFTIVHKSHFYTYSAILKYNFKVFWSWRTKLDEDFYNAMLPDQLVNHFQNIINITRKDTLWKSYQLLRTYTPAVSKVLPETFLLPGDYLKLKTYASGKGDSSLQSNKTHHIFIVKPLALSRGRQIQLFRDPLEIEYSVPSLAQIYITNSMLINRRKVDFRLYVGLFFNAKEHSYAAFLFKEGLARICSKEYNIDNIQCVRAHLTNTSINGEHETAFLRTRMPYTDALSILSVTYNVDKSLLESLVKRAIIVGVMAGTIGAYNIGGSYQTKSCFELLGADVLLSYDSKTETPHAHLLEFNASPSLAINCPLDKEIKPQIISTMLSLATANLNGFLTEFAATIKERVDQVIPSKQYDALLTSIKKW